MNYLPPPHTQDMDVHRLMQLYPALGANAPLVKVRCGGVACVCVCVCVPRWFGAMVGCMQLIALVEKGLRAGSMEASQGTPSTPSTRPGST